MPALFGPPFPTGRAGHIRLLGEGYETPVAPSQNTVRDTLNKWGNQGAGVSKITGFRDLFRVSLALLIAIAAVTAVGLLFASGGDDKEITFTPVPVERSIPVVSEESLQEALPIAKTSGVVESISGGQKWTYDFVSVARVGGAEAVSFDVQWEEPVASSGPWSLVWCKNTCTASV